MRHKFDDLLGARYAPWHVVQMLVREHLHQAQASQVVEVEEEARVCQEHLLALVRGKGSAPPSKALTSLT
jgi:hypothetical protein